MGSVRGKKEGEPLEGRLGDALENRGFFFNDISLLQCDPCVQQSSFLLQLLLQLLAVPWRALLVASRQSGRSRRGSEEGGGGGGGGRRSHSAQPFQRGRWLHCWHCWS